MLNFYSLIKSKGSHNPGFDLHHIELPFRMLINCSSGSGKSNYVLNLLRLMTNTFTQIVICTKAPEPLYDLLQEKVETVRVHYYSEGGIPDLDPSTPEQNKIVIYDDLVTTHDPKISESFIRGRKQGWSCVYISQSYFQTPKLIRQNVNYIALGRGINLRDLRMILSEYSLDMTIDQMKELYHKLTSKKMHFMTIDLLNNNIRSNIEEKVWPRE